MRQNLDPAVWGPAAWSFLRSCASACDEGSQEAYKRFFATLPDVLPCEQCREHSARYLAAHPVDTSDLVGWVDRFRRAVGERKATQATQLAQAAPRACASCGLGRKIALWVLAALAVVALVLLLLGLAKLLKVD